MVRYFVALGTACQNTKMLFDVALHDTTGAAMSARVVQFTPAKCWGSPSLTASALTQ
ncbi:hypothetical protein [Candidatus Poriferisocius sp.]|uniref:hypothetical protein n=1 Tax=Candidatus Poriferisocius sp. TaxID=3101276 RepID=UPI003B0261C8